MISFFVYSLFVAIDPPVIICPNRDGKNSFGVRENYIFSNKCYDTTYNSTPNMFTDVLIRDTIHAHKNHNYQFKNVYKGFCPLGIIHIGFSATLSVHNLNVFCLNDQPPLIIKNGLTNSKSSFIDSVYNNPIFTEGSGHITFTNTKGSKILAEIESGTVEGECLDNSIIQTIFKVDVKASNCKIIKKDTTEKDVTPQITSFIIIVFVFILFHIINEIRKK